MLSLVDLAGSEKNIDSMHHSAQRRKEGAQINASLMALKECVRARASGKNRSHVYRKSKLTMALKGSFVLPTARTMIIATVSPSSKDTEHSLNTLRHACIMDLKEGGGARRKRTAQERSKDKYEITYNTKGQPTKTLKKTTASNSSEESVHRVYGSTVVDISIPPPSFKPIALFFSRSPLSKTSKQVFFNPINIFEHLLHTLFYYYQSTFSFNVKFIFLQSKIKRNGERGKESKGGYSWTEDIGEINVSREARILKSKKGGIASLQSNGNDGYQKDKHSTTLSAKEIRRQRIGKYSSEGACIA